MPTTVIMQTANETNEGQKPEAKMAEVAGEETTCALCRVRKVLHSICHVMKTKRVYGGLFFLYHTNV